MMKSHSDLQILPATFDKRKTADLLVIPCWKKKGKMVVASYAKELGPIVNKAIDFKGDLDETLFIYPKGQKEKRFLLLGLGNPDSIAVDGIRKAYATVAKVCQKKEIKNINVILPEVAELFRDELIRASTEGLLLGNYAFISLKHDVLKDSPVFFVQNAFFIGLTREEEKIVKKAKKIVDAVHFVRDLVNRNADDTTPQELAKSAKELAKAFPAIKVQVFDKKRITKEKMGLLLAVNRGGAQEPVFIIASYRGDPHSKETLGLVGKGITYDTGGLNIKTVGMETMKADMAGGATVLGCLYAAAALGLKKNITAFVPSTENAIGPKSYKPGDVYQAHSGKMVEITNTDAEGRLILADALSYAVKHYSLSGIIDMGTLTGAMVVALGEEIAGLFSNNKEMTSLLEKASKITGEMVWPMPLHHDYKKLLKSDVGDIKNSSVRSGGSILCALFLHEFIGKTPWVHLDIAGPAFLSKPSSYNPMFGTGMGVRLLIEFLEQLPPKFSFL